MKKKKTWVKQVNSSKLFFRLWDYDNLVKIKLKKNYETQSLVNIRLKDTIEIENRLKKDT